MTMADEQKTDLVEETAPVEAVEETKVETKEKEPVASADASTSGKDNTENKENAES